MMKTINKKHIKWTTLLLTLVMLLSSVGIAPVSAEEAPAEGKLAITEICAAPSVGDNYEFIEITAVGGDVDLSDYSVCRFGFSHGGKYAATGLSQILGVNDPLFDLDILDFSKKADLTAENKTVKEDDVAILWFVNSTSTLKTADFLEAWQLDDSVNVIRVAHASPATNINGSAGNNFLPSQKASFLISLIQTDKIPSKVALRQTVEDTSTNPKTTTVTTREHDPYTLIPSKVTQGAVTTNYGIELYETKALQDKSDCVALYYTTDTANNNSHHYDGFVNLDNYRVVTMYKSFYAMENPANPQAAVITPSANVMVAYDDDGYTLMKGYWNGSYTGAVSADDKGYAYVADGRVAPASPGEHDDADVGIEISAAQNRIVNSTQDVRFVGWVDSTNYQSIGIRVTAAYVNGGQKQSKGTAQSLSTKKVYSSIKGGDNVYTTASPEIGKGQNNGYLTAISVTGIDISADTHIIFYATPFCVRNDGTEVYGQTVSVILNGTKLTGAEAQSYRIMTFNVLRANQRKENGVVVDHTTIDYNASLKSIIDYDPDVVGFQEYCAAFTGNLTKKLNDNGYTMIGNPYDTQRADPSGKTLYTDQNMAPIAYKTNKFNCLASGAACVSGTYDPPTNTYPGHWITWAVLQDKTSGEIFAVANTHGFHKSQADVMASGQLQYHVPAMVETIFDLMNNAEAKAVKGSDFVCPVLFVGDYNMRATAAPYGEIFRQFLQSSRYKSSYGVLADARFVALKDYTNGAAGHTLGLTNRATADANLIDHVFVTESVGVIDQRICISAVTTAASDHYPVYVDVVLSKQP